VLSLSAWYADVLKRHEQLAAWTAGGVSPPPSVWLPGLFNPKAFLTAVMQTYARAHGLPLDVMRFVTDVTTKGVDQVGQLHGAWPAQQFAAKHCRHVLPHQSPLTSPTPPTPRPSR
jgi:hypothetical protein